ncbi:hypothetical protein NIE88_07720 [Sporolactobacillus shoreicorticis]|uniref:DUF6944 family repetitive protein n=1 Tax=Sporolactobacillus shoreicorticis TaxID=1923877 RepID=A0ABW5S6W3_9BACL|nr:hypothetical protein [Sporolactobacillus shoreicorticis]MCO7125655.1 hypothetical protein [Sporolactobacillus shoreicorticis]
MKRNELSKNIAFTSIAIGKFMNSIGQTPIKSLDRETQDQLVFLGSLIQVGAGALLAEFVSDDPLAQLSVALTIISYGSFAVQFLHNEDDDRKLLVQSMSSNLKEVLANMILLTDRGTWKKTYLFVGIFMLCLGNFIQAQGRKKILDEQDDYTIFDPTVTAGTWIETSGAIAIMLGNLAETA